MVLSFEYWSDFWMYIFINLTQHTQAFEVLASAWLPRRSEQQNPSPYSPGSRLSPPYSSDGDGVSGLRSTDSSDVPHATAPTLWVSQTDQKKGAEEEGFEGQESESDIKWLREKQESTELLTPEMGPEIAGTHVCSMSCCQTTDEDQCPRLGLSAWLSCCVHENSIMFACERIRLWKRCQLFLFPLAFCI